ncbi:hypothetical protein [Microbacterium sp. CPCC 204701]|uniref:hypothetical protein n=1 Tax=Microbacterium sp. CPCC 204701 TaxID=2493084 RepID=UPI00197C792B|nr:hypothetical protein [Microbacterium sp. CPCC 204701]
MAFEPEQRAAAPGATGEAHDAAHAAAQSGQQHMTTDHDAIRQWAEDRHATPATLEGAEHDGHLDVLRFDFGFGMVEAEDEQLRGVGWDEWFRAFDEQGLSFVYQDRRPDGSSSNFFRFEARQGGAG